MMFSYVLIILGMVFQSTDAARSIFTINNSPPNNAGAFGDMLLEGNNREAFLNPPSQRSRTPNEFAAMNVPLRQGTTLKYFNVFRRPTATINVSTFMNTLYVS